MDSFINGCILRNWWPRNRRKMSRLTKTRFRRPRLC
jgi:hypothetical protein